MFIDGNSPAVFRREHMKSVKANDENWSTERQHWYSITKSYVSQLSSSDVITGRNLRSDSNTTLSPRMNIDHSICFTYKWGMRQMHGSISPTFFEKDAVALDGKRRWTFERMLSMRTPSKSEMPPKRNGGSIYLVYLHVSYWLENRSSYLLRPLCLLHAPRLGRVSIL